MLNLAHTVRHVILTVLLEMNFCSGLQFVTYAKEVIISWKQYKMETLLLQT